jgi:hypothetical protein
MAANASRDRVGTRSQAIGANSQVVAHKLQDRAVQKVANCFAKERKPILNYQFSQEEVTLIRLALGIALKQFEDCLEGEAPQMLAYINQPSWSEASQAARTMIEQLSIPGLVLTINTQARSRN